jgi:predicted alpha/beta-hydrolase family hydrolase
VHFSQKDPHPVRILYFHGGGAKTKDGIIERMAAAMDSAGVTHEIFSLPYEGNRGQIEELIASSPGKVILAGHSLGAGYAVNELMRRHAGKIQASFLINPVSADLRSLNVPTLVIRGSQDAGASASSLEAQFPNVMMYVAKGGDHSLRYRLRESDDRQAANVSEDTKAMNLTVGKEIAEFLSAYGGEK